MRKVCAEVRMKFIISRELRLAFSYDIRREVGASYRVLRLKLTMHAQIYMEYELHACAEILTLFTLDISICGIVHMHMYVCIASCRCKTPIPPDHANYITWKGWYCVLSGHSAGWFKGTVGFDISPCISSFQDICRFSSAEKGWAGDFPCFLHSTMHGKLMCTPCLVPFFSHFW